MYKVWVVAVALFVEKTTIYFFIELSLPLCQKSIDYIYVGICLDSLIYIFTLSTISYYLNYCRFTVGFWNQIEFFNLLFFKMVLAISVLLSFHKILEYACQCLFKMSAGILIGIALTLYIKLEITDSMTIFSLQSINTVLFLISYSGLLCFTVFSIQILHFLLDFYSNISC